MLNVIRAQPTEDGYAHNPGRARGEGGTTAGRHGNPDAPFLFHGVNRSFPAALVKRSKHREPAAAIFLLEFAAAYGTAIACCPARMKNCQTTNGVGA